MISATDETIQQIIYRLDNQAKEIKEEVYRISWYMRGGVDSHDLLWNYSAEDREIMASIIKSNIESTKNSRMPLL